ncbi:hypothetical protein Fmac_020604 [Flemingia macrophylla]|uniref:Cardiolipin synthase N-terminal domain-containing protein n=1 Tax=Flemingia macrophylla TaxID=520843 RepID=A0ABD1LUG5_9FABA
MEGVWKKRGTESGAMTILSRPPPLSLCPSSAAGDPTPRATAAAPRRSPRSQFRSPTAPRLGRRLPTPSTGLGACATRSATASSGKACFVKPLGVRIRAPLDAVHRKHFVCRSLKKETPVDGNNGNERDWSTSVLLFLLWAALIYYVFLLTPNQTPVCFLSFHVLLLATYQFNNAPSPISSRITSMLWYLVIIVVPNGLLPTGRSSKNIIPVWPFLILSCFGGAYALLPYFVLWNPPAPPVEETQLKTWPLNFLESKVTAAISLAAGLAIITYAGLAGQDVWKEFFQYFRESKFIHIMSLDFIILSTFAPFWVYNDMTARKWFDKGSWLLPISLIPFLGPGLYLLLRPTLSTVTISHTPVEPE